MDEDMEFENEIKIEMKNVIFEIYNETEREIFFVTEEINGYIIWKTQEKEPNIHKYVFLKFWKGNSKKLAIEHCKEMCLAIESEILPITLLPLPFDPNSKIFNCVDEEAGEVLGEPYSHNDWIDKIKSS